jgi:opine dehydrogenase
MSRVAVIGNTHRNLGAACAADLALAGHAVRYCVYPEQAAQLQPLREQGGFIVQGDPEKLLSRRTGTAILEAICDTPEQALEGAEVVLLDVSMPALETAFAALIPFLPQGAVVHVQSHGYWPSARLTPLLRAAGRTDVLVTEAVAPTHAVTLTGGTVTSGTLRRGLEVATIPGDRVDEALARLHPLFPDLLPAPSVLQTGLECLNLMVHPAMVLLGVATMEQNDLQGQNTRFYRECNVPSAGALAEALDAERGRVCAAYGIRHRTLPAAIGHYYGTSGTGVYESILNCAAYQSFGSFPASTWRGWESVDVPYAVVPLVRLAEQAGIATPLHRALAEIFGALIGFDPWTAGPSLEAMDLAGSPRDLATRIAVSHGNVAPV